MVRPALKRGRDIPIALSDAYIVEEDYRTGFCQSVDEGEVPEIHVTSDMHQHHEGGARFGPNASVCQFRTIGENIFRFCSLLGVHC